MTLTNAITRIAAMTNKLATDTKFIARAKSHLNEVCRREWNNFPWKHRQREYLIPTVAEVTSVTTGGTVSVTASNPLITFSSAVLSTTEHKGWYFRVTTDDPNNWYKIVNVASTTTAYLSPAYQGSTAGTATFELRKLDYDLPPEVGEVKRIKFMATNGFVDITDPATINATSLVSTTGMPQAAVVIESNPIPTTYTTGTATGTIATNTLTGIGTAWLTNVLPGDCLTVGGYDYKVYEVLTDTSLVLYNALKTSPSGATYSIKRQFVKKIRLNPIADRVYTLTVMGLRLYHDLVADTDSNELLNLYDSAVIQSCVELEQIHSPDSRADAQNVRASTLWEHARSSERGTANKRKSNPIFNFRQNRRR